MSKKSKHPWPYHRMETLMEVSPEEKLRRATLCDLGYNWLTVDPPETACKHGQHGCEVCGTTDRRDRVHVTRGGRGAVGRLSVRRPRILA